MSNLKLLGGAMLEAHDVSLLRPASRRHPMALLSLLAIAPHRTSARGQLIALLWPDVSTDTGRNRLNTYVHQLRSTLGKEAVVSIGDHLRLDPALLSCDVWAFEDAVRANDPTRAAALYDGPLLEGFYLPGSVEFERRIDRERDRLQRAYMRVVETLAEQGEKRSEFRVAADRWLELAAADPYDSRVARRLMQALVNSGNRAAALRVADDHTRLLDEEIGVEPSEEVQALATRLRDREPLLRTALTGEAEAVPPQSLAVLPFDNLTGSDEAHVFAEGLHADLLTELSRLSDLVVISRSSVLRYRGGTKSLGEIADELGVRIVVEGEVQQVGSRVRLRIQLIDAERDAHLWAERYDRELSPENLFSLQSELTIEIARALKAELSDTDRARLERLPTRDLESYRLYVGGRTRLEQRTTADMRAAEALFRRAIECDPRFAAAWAGLAESLALLTSYHHVPARSELQEGLEAANRAVALDPDLTEGRVALGIVHLGRKDGPAAVRSLRRAVELSPGDAKAHSMLGFVLGPLGRLEEAWVHLERAGRLNPMAPEIQFGLGVGFMLVDRPLEESLQHAVRARELSPGYPEAYQLEGQILTALGRIDEAIATIRRGVERSSEASRPRHLASLIHACVVGGRTAEARVALAEMEGDRKSFFLGMGRATLGLIDEAFDTFVRVDWTALHSVHLRCDPALDTLRTDPRYQPLIEDVNRSWGLQPNGQFPEALRHDSLN